MTKLKLNGLALGLAALLGLSSASYAQNPNPGQGRGQRGQRAQRAQSIATLSVAAIDAIAKLTPDQKTKVTAIHDKFVADSRALRPAQGQQPDPANRQKLRDLSAAASRDILALMTDEQKRKLQQGAQEMQSLRSAGVPPALVGDLKLTDDQKKKIADIQKERTEKMRGLTPEDRRTKGREIQQETRAKVEALLTADQKAQIEKFRKENPQRGRNRP